MDDNQRLDDAMAELSSAEDFFQYFGVEFDPAVVLVNRLHILQRFHDYLAMEPGGNAGGDDVARASAHRRCLRRAYEDFVKSDAVTEKVFAVFRHTSMPAGGQSTFVPLDKVFK